ncbi:MAG: B12-binding domain-containing radical SAM protein [Planctomycetota bacterium]|jgi:anaerobic magnesium-protoporphyrin IX monomethyl ester cyclase
MRREKIEKVQLVFPPPKRPDTRVTKFARWPQPLGILSIGAYLGLKNPEVNVEILDGNNILTLDEVISKINADVVGLTATAVGYEYAIEVAKVAKGRGASVVLGGAAATPLAKEILTYYDFVDAVVRYDGEIAFSKYIGGEPLEFIENLVYRNNGEIKENPTKLPDISELPAPDRGLVDMEVYFENSKDPEYPICDPFRRPMNIYSQKGCVWRSQEDGGCIFCSIPYYDLRLRDPELVWDEISFLVEKYRTDFIWDPSDNLIGDKDWFKSFCAVKPKALNIHYTNYVDAKGIDEEVARLLAETGCCSVFVGMEAGDPDMLKNMNKRSTLEDNIRAMEMLRKYRIGVIVGVVTGVPGESEASLARTFEFLKRLLEFDNLDRIEWGSLIPFPGSRANTLLREHRALRDKYRDFGDENYTRDMMSMIEDWYKYFCEIDFDCIQHLQDKVVDEGLVPYEMTKYQRRSWSGTPSKLFLE